MKITPTKAQFTALENAYDYFNTVLFSGELPPIFLNLSRKSKAAGFAAPKRWTDTKGVTSIHEISINPIILDQTVEYIFATLVHEMCHTWQFDFGKTSRNGYHNKQWADKMLAVGLIPSSTGEPGGKMTGQNMSDYPQENGRFLQALDKMPKEFLLPFKSIEGVGLTLGAGGGVTKEGSSKKTKTKYTCPECEVNAWGKDSLNLRCEDCDAVLMKQN